MGLSASELCKTATKDALLSNILAATSLNYPIISLLLIYSELDYTLKREQKVVHETLPTDILNETGCHSPLHVLIFLFSLNNTVERGWPQLLHIWLVPNWSEKVMRTIRPVFPMNWTYARNCRRYALD